MPIVIDCGGSTRIKLILAGGAGAGVGAMERLMDVVVLGAAGTNTTLPAGVPNGTRGSQHLPIPNPGNTLNIVLLDSTGTAFTIPINPLPASFLIKSSLAQNVRGDFEPAGLRITVYGSAPPGGPAGCQGVDPLVRAEQHQDAAATERRRYTVTNAAAIQTIARDVTVANPNGVQVLDAANPAVPGGGPQPAQGAAIYVSVVVN